MRTIILIIGILLIACNCNKKEINVLNSYFVDDIGLFPLENDSIFISQIHSFFQLKLPEFNQVDSIGDYIDFNSYSIYYEDGINPPDTNFTDRFGRSLSLDEKIKLSEAKSVIYITIKGSKDLVYEKQLRISKSIYDFTQQKNIIIADFNSTEWFNPTSWKKQRIDNFEEPNTNVVDQISIHVYRDDELCRAISMGLNKFCLPEISIKGFTCSHSYSYVSLINAVAQTLSEHPFINEDSTLKVSLNKIQNEIARGNLDNSTFKNAKRVAKIKLKKVEPEQGDNLSTQFALKFDNVKYSSPQEEQEFTISSLFGSEDAIQYINHDDLLLKTSQKAKERMPELREMFNEGLGAGYAILVKAPFKTDNGGNEWMWVEVTKWANDSMTGILQNDPFEIKGLKSGAVVNIKESELFDYMLYKPDGTYEGNETGKLIEKINKNGL